MRRHIHVSVFLQALLVCSLILITGTVRSDEEASRRVQFNRDVRPILSEACFTCHGPDAGQRQGELRLDTKSGLDAARAADVLAASDGNVSELIRRITSDAPEIQMPPPDSGHTLSDRQVSILRAWVRQGAAWQQHWAYLVPVRSPPPGPPAEGSPVDRFLHARLRQKKRM